MPPCSRELSRSLAMRSNDADKPFRFDPSEIRSRMAREGSGRIQDIGPSLIAHKDGPMPERLPSLAMPLHGKKGRRRERRPGRERRLSSIRSKAVPFEQASNMRCVRPQSVVGRDDSQPLRRPLSRRVAHAGQDGHAGDAASRAIELYDRLERLPSNIRFQISDLPSQTLDCKQVVN